MTSPKAPSSCSPIHSVDDAAHYLGVSTRTIRRLVASRAISHRRVGGLVRFTQDDLQNYVERSLVVAES
jgi:excisionase family DNA binding protein